MSRTLGNIPSSAGRLLGDIGTAIRHPIRTSTAIAEVGRGAIAKAIPGKQTGFFDEEKFDQVVDFFKQRYGGVEQIQQTIETDPVGFAADIAGLLTGTGAAVKADGTAGKVSSITKAGALIQKSGLAIEPLNLIGKGLFISTFPIRKV